MTAADEHPGAGKKTCDLRNSRLLGLGLGRKHALTELFKRSEDRAIEAIDWYLADKRLKRRISQILRGATILLGAAGGLAPLVALSFPQIR